MSGVVVLTGDTGSHTSLPCGDDDSMGDDGTALGCVAQQCRNVQS